jgi:ubiquinone biosynthesis protein
MAISIKRLERIERTYKHFKRFEEVVGVIFKYGLQDLIKGFELPAPVNMAVDKILKSPAKEYRDLSLAHRVRLALEELGPSYIKLGQILSLRVEYLPPEIIDELTKLQDNVPPFAFSEVKEIIESDLKGELDMLFPKMEEQPIGSASLGQVHKAFLPDGTKVVVKVQRPHIRDQIEVDLEIMMYLAQLVENNIVEMKYRQPTKMLEEFADSLEQELDYKMEEAHILRFKDIFRYDRSVHIMDCFPDLSTSRVLAMEYIDGIKAREVERLRTEGYDCARIADRGVDAVLKQIFEEGFFHADPHPGNIFVLEDNVISFVDFGMVGRLKRRHRELMAEFLLTVSQRDEARAVKLLLKMTDHPEELDLGKLERQIGTLVDRYVSKSLKDISFSRLFLQLSNILSEHHMIMPTDFSMMIKAIITLEGLGKSLDPQLNLTRKVSTYFHRLQLERLHPGQLAQDASGALMDLYQVLRDIPEQLNEALSKMAKGDTRLKVEHRADESFERFWNQVTNRLSFSLILASLLVSSSIMVQADIPPKWNDIPVIGLIGFVIAGFMSLRWLFSVWRHGMF